MIRRILTVAVPVLLLVGLIAYSQIRHEALHVSGFIEADEIRVGSRLGGRVLSVHVAEGERVSAGQLLVQLEPFDLRQREQEARKTLESWDAKYRSISAGFRPEEIAQAKARFEQFKARLELLEAGPRAPEINAAQGRLDAAEAELVLATQNYERASQLFESQATSRSEFDRASEESVAAKAMVVVRREELELLKMGTRKEEISEAQARVDEAEQAWQLAKNGYRQEEIDQAKAARGAAEASLEVILEQKKELTIASPTKGVIEALELQKGDLIPGGAPVLSIMDEREMWVRAYVPQSQIVLKVGQPLKVTVDGFRNEEFRGEVSFISRQAEFTPSNVQTPEERSKQVFRIKVAIKGGKERLRPGMTADVWLGSAEDSP